MAGCTCLKVGGSEPVLLVQHEGFVQMVLTGDGRLVTGGRDGRLYCVQA